jgi:hypothetical protein
MRGGVALAALLLSALVVDASLLVRQDITVSPAATVPVTLAAIGGVNTVLGASATSASVGPTTAVGLPILALPTPVLTVVRGSAAWEVQVRVLSTTGLLAGDSVTVTLAGATSQSVTVTSATSLPVTSAAVSLPPSGPDITIRVASGVLIVGGCGGLSTCTLAMQILLQPAGGGPLLADTFTLRAT